MAVSGGKGWWAGQDLNLGPHPYQLNAGNRCADRRSRRSRPTVGAKGMRSIGAQVCVLAMLPDPVRKGLIVYSELGLSLCYAQCRLPAPPFTVVLSQPQTSTDPYPHL